MTLLWLLGIVLVCLAGLQFAREPLPNPPVTADIQAPVEVKQFLRKSCYNCHSNETRLPWFDEIVPAYWLVSSDVTKARKSLNFSEIGNLTTAQQKGKLFESLNFIQFGTMPLPSYLMVHPEAEVTAEDRAMLRAYLEASEPRLLPTARKIPAVNPADAQYKQWMKAAGAEQTIAPEFNGLEFIPEYKTWRPISSTDRFDNHTMRQILGNDVAIKAIAAGQINPWPDGTAFAKVAWTQQPEDQGVLQPGEFLQVELMVRDSKKYESTKGWGWGRWRGMNLKPYGFDKDFTHECIGCHEPVRKNDYVYTMPFKGQQAGVN